MRGKLTISAFLAVFSFFAGTSNVAAQAHVQTQRKLLTAGPDRQGVELATYFGGLDRKPVNATPGRILGHARATAAGTDDKPSWLGYFTQQVQGGITGGWRHPLSDVVPVVMSVTGGRAGPMSWTALACGGALAEPITIGARGRASNGDYRLPLRTRCRSGAGANLLVDVNVQGVARRAFGTWSPASTATLGQVGGANLLPGHKLVVVLPGKHLLVQVQWRKPTPPSSGLPSVERFGPSKAPAVTRGLWLLAPDGAPLQALIGPTDQLAVRVGIADRWEAHGQVVALRQDRRAGEPLRWWIDKSGVVRHNGQP